MDEDADALGYRLPFVQGERFAAQLVRTPRPEGAVFPGQPAVLPAVGPLEDGDALRGARNEFE